MPCQIPLPTLLHSKVAEPAGTAACQADAGQRVVPGFQGMNAVTVRSGNFSDRY